VLKIVNLSGVSMPVPADICQRVGGLLPGVMLLGKQCAKMPGIDLTNKKGRHLPSFNSI